MSYKTPTLYGFRVTNNLSDVISPIPALLTLGLNIGDLEIIRGAASEEGAVREDLVAISNLEVPLYKTLDRYQGETAQYRGILERSAGVDTVLRGNLDVNGGIGGSAIRFKFTDYTVRLNYSTGSGTFILNERVTDGTDATTTGIIREIGSGFIIIDKITGGPFVNGRVFTGSFSGATLTVASSENITTGKFADISTSRVSAWSTASAGTPSDADPVFYGGQLRIADGGKVIVDRVTWGQVAQSRLRRPDNTFITGEIPTHTLDVTINNAPFKLYAMKSIPLKFRGFFRRFDGRVDFNSAVPNSRVSWRVVNVNIPNDVQLYTEVGTTSLSTLAYRSITAGERDIEIYYHPDFITRLDLAASGIFEVPAAELPALTTLQLQNNSIKDMPNFKEFAPNLRNLQFFRNSLFLADDPTLRRFTKEVADRLPSGLTTLNMHGTFGGTIRCVDDNNVPITTGIGGVDSYSVIEKACPGLVSFSVQRGSGPSFAPDDYDSLAHLPSMPDTVTSYFAGSNDFRRVPARGLKELPNLVNFNVAGNYNLIDSTFSLTSNNLVDVRIGSSGLPVPDLSLKPALVTFEGQYLRNAGSLFNNDEIDDSFKLRGCGSLQNIFMYGANAVGFIPKFKGNSSLRHVDWYANQRLTGGRPDNGEHGYADGKTFVMYNDTFEDARNISFFRVLSNSLLVGKGFEPDTFKNLSNLSYLFWYSYGRTGSGSNSIGVPDVSSCPNLRHLIMPVNNFTGIVPSMSTNNRIFYIDLSNNRLSGPVPTYTSKLSLLYVFLHNNQLTSFPGFEGTSNMIFAYMQNNQITGAIPDIGSPAKAPRLQRFYAFNNQFSSYTVGSFTGLTRIQFLDISRNNLTEFDLNNIIDDLYANYLSAPRRGVNINLNSQARAPGYNPSLSGGPREQDIAEKIAFLRNAGWIITIG